MNQFGMMGMGGMAMGMGIQMGGMPMMNNNEDEDWMRGFKMGVDEVNNNKDDEWLKGFKMGVEEVNNPADKDDLEANASGLKLNAIFTTIQGLNKNVFLKYGTTIDQALKKYLNLVNKPELVNDNRISFIFNAKKIKFGDYRKVENYFGTMTPKIVVSDPLNLINTNQNPDNKSDSKNKELINLINNLRIQNQAEINKNYQLQLIIENLKNQLNNEIKRSTMLNEQNKQLKMKLNEMQKNNIYKNNNINKDKQLLQLYKRIDELKEELSRYPFELLKGEKMISVIFTSVDQKIHYSIICKNTEKFIRLEEKLYNDYPEYSDSDSFFTVNGKLINKFKTLEENQIHNSDIIILNKRNTYI